MRVEGGGEDKDILSQAARLLRVHPAMAQAAAGGHLDEDALAAFVAGAAGEQHAALLAHVASCARCRHAAAALTRVLADDRIAGELARVHGSFWSRGAGWTATLTAAAAIALLVLWPRATHEPGVEPPPPTTYREPAITAAGAPTLIVPRGRVAAVSVLAWSHVPGADRYRLTVFDQTGVVVWEREVTDTLAALAGTGLLKPGVPYFWKVEAKTGRKRWVASDLVEFSIGGSAGRP